MGRFQIYAVGIILTLMVLWLLVPYFLGVVILLIVASQIVKLTRKISWNS